MAVDAEDWCHAMFLPSLEAHGAAEGCFAETPLGQSLQPQLLPEGAAATASALSFLSPSLPYVGLCHRCLLNLSITYKIALLTFKAMHQFSPAYLTDLLSKYLLSHSLRSYPAALLSNPTFKERSFGSRPFSVSAPPTWKLLLVKVHESEGFFLPVLQTPINSYRFSSVSAQRALIKMLQAVSPYFEQRLLGFIFKYKQPGGVWRC